MAQEEASVIGNENDSVLGGMPQRREYEDDFVLGGMPQRKRRLPWKNLLLFALGTILGLVLKGRISISIGWDNVSESEQKSAVPVFRTPAPPAFAVPCKPASVPNYAAHNQSFDLALTESEGFMLEMDGIWKMRKERQSSSMEIVRKSFESCPKGAHGRQVHCFPACDVTYSFGVPPFMACRDNVFSAEDSRKCHAPGMSPLCHTPEFWQAWYEPSFSCMFKRRIGVQGEGGKWVCDPHLIRAKIDAGKGCLVYSIGSSGDFNFERTVHDEISPKCEIHTVDMKPWQEYKVQEKPDFVSYHVHTIGPKPQGTPVSSLVRELGHQGRTIDLFKIDCEGCEWSTFRDWLGEGVYIRQILVELHNTGSFGSNPHDFFNFLFNQGYVIFNKEPNTLAGGECLEYGLLKLSPSFAKGS